MTDPIAAKGLAKRFWEKKPLTKMSQDEWESLCDGCGKCCLNKLEDEDTEEVALTRVACRLLDDATCRCSHYENRHQFVPDCIVLKPENLDTHAYWMPLTCAYRLLWQGCTARESRCSITPSRNSTPRSRNGKTTSSRSQPDVFCL